MGCHSCAVLIVVVNVSCEQRLLISGGAGGAGVQPYVEQQRAGLLNGDAASNVLCCKKV